MEIFLWLLCGIIAVLFAALTQWVTEKQVTLTVSEIFVLLLVIAIGPVGLVLSIALGCQKLINVPDGIFDKKVINIQRKEK